MLVVLYGTDVDGSRKAFDVAIAEFNKKHGTHLRIHLDEPASAIEKIEEYTQGSTLFTAPFIITGINLLSTKTIANYLLENEKKLSDSPTLILILEESLEPALEKKLGHGAKLVTHNATKKNGTQTSVFNLFLLTDALALRDRKLLWVLFQKALRAGIPAEEVFWKFLWQIKTMLIVSATANAEDAGVHPFVYQKAKSGSKRFSSKELQLMSEKLISLFESDKEGRGELHQELELFILAL